MIVIESFGAEDIPITVSGGVLFTEGRCIRVQFRSWWFSRWIVVLIWNKVKEQCLMNGVLRINH